MVLEPLELPVENRKERRLEDQLPDEHDAHQADHEVEEAHGAGEQLDENERDVAAGAPLPDHPQRVCELPDEEGTSDGPVDHLQAGTHGVRRRGRPTRSTAVQRVTARVGRASEVAGVRLATAHSSTLVATRPSAYAATVRPRVPNQLSPSSMSV